jgi:hypothetical protein
MDYTPQERDKRSKLRSQRDTCDEIHCQNPKKPTSHQETASNLMKQFHATGSMALQKMGVRAEVLTYNATS